jgi:hypothetical protein
MADQKQGQSSPSPSVQPRSHSDSLIALSPQSLPFSPRFLYRTLSSFVGSSVLSRSTLHRSSPGFGYQKPEISPPRRSFTIPTHNAKSNRRILYCKEQVGVQYVCFSYINDLPIPILQKKSKSQNLPPHRSPPPIPQPLPQQVEEGSCRNP